ncbi:hypothetical protein GCM10009863_67630 [Streptomyces axinellae]|uniref:Transposase IS701-like DDE domain-containing protein n=1 Tax=Streptomyces axinellae TaxID=552788 RepID=A0ABP6DE21_9ACTN
MDEAQWLNGEAFEYFRHLRDEPATQLAIIFVGGKGCHTVLRREPMLSSRIFTWLRPDAHTSPERILCHTYGRGKDQHIPVPGWPYSVICALETGRSSWTAPLDALRPAPGDDGATVTARQMRELIERLIEAGQWRQGDLDILVVLDAGYDVPPWPSS